MIAASARSEFVQRLPKVELHCHLPGAVPVETYLDLAIKNGVPVRGTDAADAYRFASFEDFLQLYDSVCRSMQTASDFETAIHAALGRQSRSGNVVYSEMFFSPSDHPDVPYAVQLEGLVAGIRAAQTDFGIRGRLIPAINRTRSARDAVAMVEEVVAHRRDEVVGIGMDNDESMGPPERFVEAYALAARHGLKRTAHAGERGSASEVERTVELLKVDRIDHGYGIVNDQRLVRRMRDARMHFATSWFVCGYQTGDTTAIARMITAGLSVSFNTDDPAIIDTDLSTEMADAASTLDVDTSVIARWVADGIEASWLDDSDKADLRRRFDTELSRLRTEFGAETVAANPRR